MAKTMTENEKDDINRRSTRKLIPYAIKKLEDLLDSKSSIAQVKALELLFKISGFLKEPSTPPPQGDIEIVFNLEGTPDDAGADAGRTATDRRLAPTTGSLEAGAGHN